LFLPGESVDIKLVFAKGFALVVTHIFLVLLAGWVFWVIVRNKKVGAGGRNESRKTAYACPVGNG
jgi:hypothetical protein